MKDLHNTLAQRKQARMSALRSGLPMKDPQNSHVHHVKQDVYLCRIPNARKMYVLVRVRICLRTRTRVCLRTRTHMRILHAYKHAHACIDSLFSQPSGEISAINCEMALCLRRCGSFQHHKGRIYLIRLSFSRHKRCSRLVWSIWFRMMKFGKTRAL